MLQMLSALLNKWRLFNVTLRLFLTLKLLQLQLIELGDLKVQTPVSNHISALSAAYLAFAAAYGTEVSCQGAFTRGESQFTYRPSEREAAIGDDLSESQ